LADRATLAELAREVLGDCVVSARRSAPHRLGARPVELAAGCSQRPGWEIISPMCVPSHWTAPQSRQASAS